MYEYVGQLIIFFAAILAVKGGTWDNSKTGIKKLTVTGAGTIVLALFGFIIALITTYQAQQQSNLQTIQLSEAVNNTSTAREKTKALEQQLSLLKRQLLKSKEILETVYDQSKLLQDRSERQPQQVMAQHVRLESLQVWEAPNNIYGGSVVKFFPFGKPLSIDLLIIYGDNQSAIRSNLRKIKENPSVIITHYESPHMRIQPVYLRENTPAETAIVGREGLAMHWYVVNISQNTYEGKIFVESSPRIRSNKWSWLEEKINPDGTLKGVQ